MLRSLFDLICPAFLILADNVPSAVNIDILQDGKKKTTCKENCALEAVAATTDWRAASNRPSQRTRKKIGASDHQYKQLALRLLTRAQVRVFKLLPSQ